MSEVNVVVIKETAEGEKRVALVPESVGKLSKMGLHVLVQSGSGDQAGFPDNAYKDSGAEIVSDYFDLINRGKIFLKVHCVCLQEGMMKIVDPFKEDSVVIGFFNPFKNIHNVEELASRGLTCFSMELIPRISRAQRMDALSVMSSAAGYKAVIMAAATLNKMFPLMMTAAGVIHPATVMVIGAGVAGLQAIATAKRLGAQILAFDTRPAVKEQVESLGATFVELGSTSGAEAAGGYASEMSEDFYRHEQASIAKYISDVDVIITTAQIFGKRAPLLITTEMVSSMKHGSVIVDLAAEQGGNCELTLPGKTVERYGVTIFAPLNLPSTLSFHTSEMFSRNVTALISEIVKDAQVQINLQDDVIGQSLLTHDGQIINKRVKELLEWEKEEKPKNDNM